MSYLSELDQDGFERRNTEDLLNQDKPGEDKAGFFRGFVKAPVLGLARGLTNLNDALLTATDLIVPMSDEERGQQEHLRRTLTDAFTPDARTVGTAGRVLGGVTESVAPLLVPEVGVPLMVGSNTLAAGKRQVDAGVDATTAGESAAIEGAASYAGLKVPIFGGTLAQRLATGAGGNLALGAGSTEAQKLLLNARGYEEMAKNYDPLDGEARAVDLLSGLVFGGLHHLTLPSEKAAVATLNNAKHFQQDTAPGVPADLAASAAHQQAMETATEQLVRGEPVNVDPSVTQASFKPRPNAGNPIPEDLQALDAARAPASVESEPEPPAAGYDVSEGVLTDEQLKQFQGLRSDVRADENVGGSGAGVSERPVVQDAGGARGGTFQVFRGIAKPGEGVARIAGGVGEYYTDNAEDARNYAGHSGEVVEKSITLKNPYRTSLIDGSYITEERAAALRAAGYDSVIGESHGVREYVLLPETPRGEPLRVYRGASRELTAEDFKPESLGFASGKPAAGLGVFFSKSKAQAAQHGTPTEHLLDIRNPKVFKAEDLPGFGSKEEASAFSKQLQAAGHDGIVIDASGVRGPVNYVAFDHGQVLKPAKGKPAAAKPKAEKPATAAAKEPAAQVDEHPETAAIRESLAENDIKIPTGERDSEGNALTRSARELLAEADAETAAAQETGKGIAAAVSCFLTRGA